MMEGKLIFKAIPAIMGEIGHIGKDSKNQQQGFMFRGIDQVMNTMKPILAKYAVFLVPEVVNTRREERQTKNGGNLIYTMHTIRFHFCAEDGSEVVATVVGEGMDSADKSSNKAMAVAFKYACFQVFCIPTEEMAKDDPDAYMPEPSEATEQQIGNWIAACKSQEEMLVLADSYGANIKASQFLTAAWKLRWSQVPEKGGAA